MPVKVHYDDNLYYVQSIMRTIEAGLRLDIDLEYFYDKILEDIFFVEATINRTHMELRDNPIQINRVDHLRALRRASLAFTVFLDKLVARDFRVSGRFQMYFEKFTRTVEEQQKLRELVDSQLDQLDPDGEQEELVSSEEFGFLLADSPEDEKPKT